MIVTISMPELLAAIEVNTAVLRDLQKVMRDVQLALTTALRIGVAAPDAPEFKVPLAKGGIIQGFGPNRRCLLGEQYDPLSQPAPVNPQGHVDLAEDAPQNPVVAPIANLAPLAALTPAAVPTRVWSEARRAVIRRDWPAGVSLDDIWKSLDALPGRMPAARSAVAVFAASLGVKRPQRSTPSTGAKGGSGSTVWTDERNATLRAEYATASLPRLLECLNALEGELIASISVMHNRAFKLGLRRDPAAIAIAIAIARTKSHLRADNAHQVADKPAHDVFVSPSPRPVASATTPAQVARPNPRLRSRDGSVSIAALEEQRAIAQQYTVDIDIIAASSWAKDNKLDRAFGESAKLWLERLNTARVGFGLPPWRIVALRGRVMQALPSASVSFHE